MMNDAHNYCCYVLYHGQTDPVWFDTVNEAITYISAENVGRGLSPVTRIVATNLAWLCFGGQDRYCGMISGSYDIYSHPDGRTIYIYYIIPQDQKYWWIVNTPDSTSETGNTIDELMQLLKSIYYEADLSPVLVPPSMFVTA